MYFNYGKKEMDYLKSKDKKLADVIEKIGHIKRRVNPDIFSSVVNSIVGQQISTKAHQTIWKRIVNELGEINADVLINASREKIQSFGLTFKKVDYILEFAEKVKRKEIDLSSYSNKSDGDIIKELSSLNGIGIWTAEMVLLHCLERPNVFSYGDLAILRGLRMVYHHQKIDKKLFEKYRKRFSPYCSVASIYFWAVSSGAIPEMRDYKK
ncbi:DNA-3-methyladenine glycosylase family protein [Streptococcus acidominimus]|uniref:DNA-3-methyladenine glycosylase II n=1 Tax=Streptococcus acidominimus TaxID=1326 RepID=A0A4Y9FKB8_STRAI|nr:DNA-3-methyladenine glycosylase [Streptococcus acidominimus]MBF0819701.1 DNA-3-methyladenine glycosylase 2 family protein [Streptococcus acidominimus]MBF0839401.1 DNA-3-methyladenine glycosylase 2 family protein [Streptococcus acidominimus]MBF0846587.1 DNA-3-methyladenine glycosylase 2 family protein [Streptococcus danieliae]TFU29571.1 DNA-3-methyladenine glycosylase 2 family protein [Streptococcus acidominimus]